jgi:hypothetical protein
LGLMAYRDPKGERDKRMPEKRRSSPGVRGGASRDPRDMAKAGLPDIPIPRRHEGQSAGKTPETGAMLCGGIVEGSLHPPEDGALPSEGNQGDEWDAYVVLGRMTGTNAGSPAGREPHGDGVPIVVVGVATHQGGRCAARRSVVSPAQPGGTRRKVLGSNGFTRIRKVKGTIACQQS